MRSIEAASAPVMLLINPPATRRPACRSCPVRPVQVAARARINICAFSSCVRDIQSATLGSGRDREARGAGVVELEPVSGSECRRN